MGRPKNLSECSPDARLFPSDWKDAWFRRHSVRNADDEPMYPCPVCRKEFTHLDLDYLEADHVWPYSLFGATIWENYRLLCSSCNSKRRDSVGQLLRRELGAAKFREVLLGYLRDVIPAEVRGSDPFIGELLSSSSGP